MKKIKELLKGKTLWRVLGNIQFENVDLRGKKGIDLGSKSDGASLYRYIKVNDQTNITFTDINPVAKKSVIKIDLEKKINLESDEYDVVILNNTLEHIYNHQNCINESFRILKKNGTCVGSVPFIKRIHYDPDDYFRYTSSSLKRIFMEAGFKDIHIKALGYGPLTASASYVVPLLKFNILKCITYLIAISFDKILNYIMPEKDNIKSEHFPLGYFFIVKK
jgi:SAM-dependent methyltransferase